MKDMIDEIMRLLPLLPKEQAREHLRELHTTVYNSQGLEYLMITDDEIKAKNYSQVHKFFKNLEPAWREYKGKVIYNIDGYIDTTDELHEIPEVLAYFKKLFKAYPHYLHFMEEDVTLKLSVRFIADSVKKWAYNEDMKEGFEKFRDYSNDPFKDIIPTSDTLIYYSRMSEENFSLLSKRIITWFESKNDIASAFELMNTLTNQLALPRRSI